MKDTATYKAINFDFDTKKLALARSVGDVAVGAGNVVHRSSPMNFDGNLK